MIKRILVIRNIEELINMSNKVRYHRLSNGELEVQVDEGNGWVPYTRSKVYTPDKNPQFCSKGYPTFLNCLKNNYEVVKLEK